MNDFTLEELQDLFDLLESEMSIHRLADNVYNRNLLSKLQILIDNYCDHQFAFHINVNGNYIQCHRCRLVLDGDNFYFKDIDLRKRNCESENKLCDLNCDYMQD